MKQLTKVLAFMLAVILMLSGMSVLAQVHIEDSELDSALNVENGTLTFENCTDYPMAVEELDGRVAVKSTNQGMGNSTSQVTLTITAEAGSMLCFDVKTSTEMTYDKFQLVINGTVNGSYTASGITDWTTKNYSITTDGEYTFEFRYSKDGSVNKNDDTVWIDNVRLILPTPVTALEIPEELEVNMGHPETIVPVFTPEDATITTLTWESTDEEVATVEDGVVTAVAPGTCDISATTVNNITAVCHVTVPEPVYPESVEINFTEAVLPTGCYTTNLIATVLPANSFDTSVTWTCEPEGIITISNGRFSAVSNLEESVDCTVTATTVNGISASMVLHVLCNDDVPGIDDLTYTSIETDVEYTGSIYWGDSQTIRFPRANPTTTFWSVANCEAFEVELVAGTIYDFLSYAPDGVTRFDTYLNVIAPDGSYLVANDDSAGLGFGEGKNVTAPVSGTYRIIISSFNYYTYGNYALKVVTHQHVPVEGIELTTPELTVGIGGVASIGYTVLPEDATDKSVTFESLSPEIAVVDTDGRVTGVAKGVAQIIVTTNEGGFTATVDVTVLNINYIFMETFDDNPASRWTVTSQSSDTDWYFSSGAKAHGGSGGYAASSSFDEDYEVFPNNYIISRAITIPADANAPILSYFISCDGYTGEHYSLYISTTGNSMSDFTETLIYETLSNTQYEERTIDLSAYVGQTIYLAWRHHGCSDVMNLKLDTISITSFEEETELNPYDLNGDGEFNMADITLLMRHALEITVLDLSPETIELLDVNGDGMLTMVDTVALLRAYLNS